MPLQVIPCGEAATRKDPSLPSSGTFHTQPSKGTAERSKGSGLFDMSDLALTLPGNMKSCSQPRKDPCLEVPRLSGNTPESHRTTLSQCAQAFERFQAGPQASLLSTASSKGLNLAQDALGA